MELKILCVCKGNTCRSPMMAAFFERELKQDGVKALIQSAGIVERDPVPASENSIQAMMEYNIDISGHRSQSVKNIMLDDFDKIYCVDQSIKDELINLGANPEKISILNEGQGGIPNPYGKDLTIYKQCAEIIRWSVIQATDDI